MNNFNLHTPTRILFGKGAIAELRDQIPQDARVLVTYGGGSVKKTGVLAQVQDALKGLDVLEFGGIEPNPSYETLMNAVKIVRDEKVTFLLAVGGGSAVGRLVPMKLIFKMQHAAALKDKHGRSSLRYYSNYQPDYLYVTIQKEWCEEITDIEFEGETLMASKYAHEVLTWVYGDYMKLPPEAERVPAHSTIDIQVFDEEA